MITILYWVKICFCISYYHLRLLSDGHLFLNRVLPSETCAVKIQTYCFLYIFLKDLFDIEGLN